MFLGTHIPTTKTLTPISSLKFYAQVAMVYYSCTYNSQDHMVIYAEGNGGLEVNPYVFKYHVETVL